ncbi:hypothetical protein EZS27_022305 [termite gut metagenome]|uniref:Uncharacterized protein n=1 Tax=termite gut metagenome TaxID=433724 RepID=A0A5J4R6F2_9ZZZZ
MFFLAHTLRSASPVRRSVPAISETHGAGTTFAVALTPSREDTLDTPPNLYRTHVNSELFLEKVVFLSIESRFLTIFYAFN